MKQTNSPSSNVKSRPGRIKWAAFLSISILALLTICGAYWFTNQLVSPPPVSTQEWRTSTPQAESWANPETPSPVESTPALIPSATPQPSQEATSTPFPLPTPDPWNGTDRVNILILGLDYGDWASEDRTGPPRSDTMILLTIDPTTMTAGMISIPRDLWVTMPGIIGYHKINTAHRFGELYEMEGGGPGLAMRTVERLLGVPVDYYARIDFYAFESFIDELGGVEVDVPEEIKVDPIGEHNTVELQPGRQLLDGPTALAYARNRHTAGGDFDRAARQQQVIMAIRDRILRLDMLPLLVYKAPDLYEELSAGIQTNMTLEEMIQLSWLASQIQTENIHSAVIGNGQVEYATSADGLAIFKPIPNRIRVLRDEIFGDDVTGGVWGEGDLRSLMYSENARVVVIHMGGDDGAAGDVAAELQSQGVYIVNTGVDMDFDDETQIIDLTGNPYTLSYLTQALGLSADQARVEYLPQSQVDIVVVLSSDWGGGD